MRWVLFICLFISLFIIKAQSFVYAQSEYVLPYPSVMPGSIFYKLHLAKEWLLKFWYFGNFGKFSYNLKQSDKYLVEAKTLFEYKQYLLGENALKKSDMHFKKTPKHLSYAKEEGKNIDRQQKVLKEAVLKHIEVLNEAKLGVPETFVWQPEKLAATTLNLKKSIEESINIRKKFYE